MSSAFQGDEKEFGQGYGYSATDRVSDLLKANHSSSLLGNGIDHRIICFVLNLETLVSSLSPRGRN